MPGGDTIWGLHGRCVGEASQVADEGTDEGRAVVVVRTEAAEKVDVRYDATPALSDEGGGVGFRRPAASPPMTSCPPHSSFGRGLVWQGEMIK